MTNALKTLRGAHVGLRVAERDAAVEWYREKLDMHETRAFDLNGMTFTEMELAGDPTFRIELVSGPGAYGGPKSDDLYASFGSQGWHHLSLWVDDVDAAVETLRDRGVTVTLEPVDNDDWKVRVAFLVDPWSNVIELLQSKV
ncbi:MAG: VOC family protein [Salipiger marinus]|uniref:VOC family protein n=1 Tax=Salipiger marinus TaxID=555512 RepID=UPI004058FA7A